jgi:thiol-disulfide isomerase/thioredoxin
VKYVLFDEEPIDLTRTFTVAVTDSLVKGGYGFGWFKHAKRLIEVEFAAQLQDLVLQYCKAKSLDPDSSAFPASPASGRITILRAHSIGISQVKSVHSKSDLDILVQTSGDKRVVLHFTVDWCVPCRVVTPLFNQLASMHPDVIFARVRPVKMKIHCFNHVCLL